MIEIVPNDTGNVMHHFAEEIRSVSRETMKTKEVCDLLSGRSIEISITNKEKELLNYDCLILSTEIRIRPAEAARDEKTELKNITNELKELAKFFDIPVITAQQLNRNGAAVVAAALQANKEDVTRLVGRDAVAGAWEIIENSDWVRIVNRVSKKHQKTFQLIIVNDLDDPSDELTFAIVHGAEDLDPKDIFADVRPIYGFELVKDAYRKALITTLRELVN